MASLWNIFAVFAKIGAFTIGGGYAMIPLIQKELERRKWIDGKELPDIIAIAQSAPGVMGVNVAIFTGYRLRGFKGSLAAALGSILPSFFIMLAIAMLFTGYQENPIVIRIFSGIRPAVIALIAVPMVQMARKNNKSWWNWGISIATLFLVTFLNYSPIYILAVVLVIGTCITLFDESRRNKKKEGQ